MNELLLSMDVALIHAVDDQTIKRLIYFHFWPKPDRLKSTDYVDTRWQRCANNKASPLQGRARTIMFHKPVISPTFQLYTLYCRQFKVTAAPLPTNSWRYFSVISLRPRHIVSQSWEVFIPSCLFIYLAD